MKNRIGAGAQSRPEASLLKPGCRPSPSFALSQRACGFRESCPCPKSIGTFPSGLPNSSKSPFDREEVTCVLRPLTMALPIPPSTMSLWLHHRHSRTMPEGFPPAPCTSRLSPHQRHPALPRGTGDGVRPGRALPLARPRSDFPPLCLPSLGSPSNLQSPTISLPLASAGCSSSLERFCRPAPGPLAPPALCAAPSSPSAWGLWARVCRGVPPTNPLPSPQSELVGQLGSVPGMELAVVDI